MQKDPAWGSARVLAVGHARRGLGATVARDTPLNDKGVLDARGVGEQLERTGVMDALDLVVVAPSRCALDAASTLLGHRAASLETLVEPLCASRVKPHSQLIKRGDLGSTKLQLRGMFPKHKFPQYDFRSLDAYCAEKQIEGGRWWDHGPCARHESKVDFHWRCQAFCQWLGMECAKRMARRVLVVTSCEFLEEVGWLDSRATPSCVVDVLPDGRASRPGLRLKDCDQSTESTATDLTRPEDQSSVSMHSDQSVEEAEEAAPGCASFLLVVREETRRGPRKVVFT